jgi:hypothetical protein
MKGTKHTPEQIVRDGEVLVHLVAPSPPSWPSG